MVLSDPTKGGLEGGAWTDAQLPEQRQKTLPLRKKESVIFSVQCIIAKNM